MSRFRRNKSELIVLTGAIYSFVAYLTAFTLEILFLIDLTRQNGDHLLSASSSSSSPSGISSASQQTNVRPLGSQIFSSSSSSSSSSSVPQQLAAAYFNGQDAQDSQGFANSFERFTIEAMQAHTTISCLAISILYFVIFVTSLTLIVALILRSTFMLLIWMCAMTTMYLPEFGLVTYVAVYSWGLGTRNGQVELAFYLFRAVLNLIFIFRAHKLFKSWSYEKNFFRLKSEADRHFGPGGGGAYNSPYFITGDSLSTTINPMFSSSTLNLNRYDYVRGGVASDQYAQTGGQVATSRNTSPTTNQSVFSSSDTNQEACGSSGHGSMAGGRGRLATASLYSRELANKYAESQGQQPERRFYLGADTATSTPPPVTRTTTDQHRHNRPDSSQMQRNESMLSINDDLDADYEMDLDYRTLTSNQRGGRGRSEQPPTSARYYNHNHRHAGGRRQEPLVGNGGGAYHYINYNQRAANHDAAMMSRSQDNLTYSTQSLDRRHLRDFGGGLTTEQVVLRPLGHQPFEYLQRPGSTSNLNSAAIGSVNTNARGANTRRHYHYGS